MYTMFRLEAKLCFIDTFAMLSVSSQVVAHKDVSDIAKIQIPQCVSSSLNITYDH